MTEQQLPKFMGEMVTFQRAFMCLPTEVAQWASQHTIEAIEAMCPALCEAYAKSQKIMTPAPAPKPPLLQLVSTITVPATTESRKASEVFVVNTNAEAKVKIAYVDPGFLSGFGEMAVGSHAGSSLFYSTLMRNAYDRDIHAALGGADKSATMLSDLWWMMEQQPNGVGEVLLADGCANIFYIFDGSSALRAIWVGWRGNGWYVRAYELDYSYWLGDGRVFVRACSVASS